MYSAIHTKIASTQTDDENVIPLNEVSLSTYECTYTYVHMYMGILSPVIVTKLGIVISCLWPDSLPDFTRTETRNKRETSKYMEVVVLYTIRMDLALYQTSLAVLTVDRMSNKAHKPCHHKVRTLLFRENTKETTPKRVPTTMNSFKQLSLSPPGNKLSPLSLPTILSFLLPALTVLVEQCKHNYTENVLFVLVC